MWLKHLKNGKVQISFVKMDSPTLISWLLQNANRFKVISPDPIKEQILQQLQESIKKYES